MGYDIKTTMKSLCVCQNIVMSLAGIIMTFLISAVVR